MIMKHFKNAIAIIMSIALVLTLAPISTSAKSSLPQDTINAIYFSSFDSATSEIKTEKLLSELTINAYLDQLVKNSNDPNASYQLNRITKFELEQFRRITNSVVPTHTLIFNYTNSQGISTKSDKYYISYSQEQVSNNVSPMWVESIFDIGSFVLSLNEFNQNPSFWSGFWVVADAAAVVFPGIPAVSGVKRMIQESPNVLKPALSKGIRSYSSLQNVTAPANYMNLGWERHHIFEKRFAGKLGSTEAKMLSIFIPKYYYHHQITQKMASKIPWWEAPFWSKDDIIQAHINAYSELWAESGFTDSYWEFLFKFTESRQYQ
ncbi:hypothetical protein I6N90_12235 [Paenibacillus sp. GSMTC-2017]|uniref:hypothetical protein n=1 Tax=Paenibacillus sp. GSMTC-2017 TaxID=2794350 RepID=UPI0018D95DB6|nr:hypothetical protein [Paenibacillus sp. GSMTC-2017]MBH5318564.1 hypothetical protein [Paenibacillus sp. GSMTC-2017]